MGFRPPPTDNLPVIPEKQLKDFYSKQSNSLQIEIENKKKELLVVLDNIENGNLVLKRILGENNILLFEQKKLSSEKDLLLAGVKEIDNQIVQKEKDYNANTNKLNLEFKNSEEKINNEIAGLIRNLNTIRDNIAKDKIGKEVVAREVKKLQNQKDDLIGAIEGLNKKSNELGQLNIIENNKLDSLKNETAQLDTLRRKVVEMNENIADLDSTVESRIAEIKDLETDVESLKLSQVTLIKEKEDFIATVALLNKQKIKNEEEARKQQKLYQRLGIPIVTT